MPRLRAATVRHHILDDPLWCGPGPDAPTTEERFWLNVDVRGLEECWPWQGTLASTGYGLFHIGSHNQERVIVGAHRFAYLLANGNPEPGRHIHHNCQTPACVNPRHLDALTPRQHQAWHRARRQMDNVR